MAEQEIDDSNENSVIRHSGRTDRKNAIFRAVNLRCPNCGSGKLFRAYLKPMDICSVCGEPLGHLRSDDAAPWLTILLVGHILVPIMVASEASDILPMAMSLLIWPAAAIILVSLILPRAKAIILGMIWFENAPGSERQ